MSKSKYIFDSGAWLKPAKEICSASERSWYLSHVDELLSDRGAVLWTGASDGFAELHPIRKKKNRKKLIDIRLKFMTLPLRLCA